MVAEIIEGILGRDFAGERAPISPVEMRIVKAFTENATILFLAISPLEIKRPKNKVMSTNVFMAVLLLQQQRKTINQSYK